MYVIFSVLLSLGAIATAAPVVRSQKDDLLFNITLLNKSLEEQAIAELARTAEEANLKINEHLSDFCTLKEVPTKKAVFIDKAFDRYVQSNYENKAARGFDYLRKWLVGTKYCPIPGVTLVAGLTLGGLRGIYALAKKPTEPLTFQDKVMRSLLAISSLAVQTYILEKTGVDKAAKLTIGDVIEIIKEKAREGNSDISHEKAKDLAQKLMRNIQTSFSKGKATQEIPADTQKMIRELEEKSALLGQQLEELMHKMAELEELKK